MMRPRTTTIPLRLQPESQPPLQGQSRLSTALFTCSICGKGFDQKRRQTRHSSYCRRSKSQPLKSRKKACVQCTKARSQCDVRDSITTKHPQCTRCQTKGIDCHFDRPPFVTHGHSPPGTLGREAEGNTGSPPVDSRHEYSSNGSSAVDLVQVSTSTTSIPDPWIESTKTVGYDELMFEFSMFETDTPAICIQNDGINTPASPLARIAARPLRSFQPNNESDYGLQLTRRYVVAVLKSYPNMLLEQHIPPFIYHSYELYEESSSSAISLPGPLSVCAGIIQMFNFKNKTNTSFIWGTIRTEQERLAAECSRFDDIELLAALQAIALYMLLRISEEDEEATNFDVPLIQTMIDLSIRISEVMAIRRSRLEAQKTMWHDWSFTESFTRTCALLCLIDLLYDLSGGNFSHHCDGSTFARLTLPCSKKLWNASSEVEWLQETHRELREPYSGRNLTYGDILDLQLGIDRCGKRLDNWLSQVDEFGSLIVAASSLSRRIRRA